LNLKQDLSLGVSLVIYIHVLHFWLAHIICMLEVIEEPQKDTEIFLFW